MHQPSRRIAPALLSVGLAFAACSAPEPTPPVTERRGAAVTADEHGTLVAAEILEAGGNAVDAAVAVGFTLAVTYPEAGNIGGGGFMLIHHDGTDWFLDYRETAPAAASRDMYLNDQGEVIPQASFVGHRAVGIPGTVRGLWEAHERFGRLEWSRLLEPAIRLASDGFTVPPMLASLRDDGLELYGPSTNFAEYFGAFQAGEVFRQPELAATLQRIADAGDTEFYEGRTAELIVEEMARGGGLITVEDLQAYRPVWRDPLVGSWRDYTVVTAPPPSSGGIALLQLLHMKDALAPEFRDVAHNSPEYIHLVAEMEKRVFADRAEYLGDPDFVDVPTDRLLAADYVESRAREVRPDAISAVEAVSPGLESHQTTHFSIVDGDGNAVSNTYTLNWDFGSGVVVAGAGFLLNDEMDDFSAKPGVANLYGVVGAEANAIQPGKRMLSSMTPTIVLRDGRFVLALGSPGGSTIFTSVFQVVVNLLDFGMSLPAAVGATRFHHQLLPPTEITYDPGMPLSPETIDALGRRGYEPRPHDWPLGDVLTVYDPGDGPLQAAADPRARGVAAVVP